MKYIFIILVFFYNQAVMIVCAHPVTERRMPEDSIVASARGVLIRTIGERANTIRIHKTTSANGLDSFEVIACKGILTVRGNSTVALCYGFNTYMKKYCHSMCTWSGKHINIPLQWPDCLSLKGGSPYPYRYYLNVVTFGYSTPYWNWARWEKELDWMALHGMNMPLALVASEAIAQRVWLQMGLRKEEISSFFTGPAHLPWHRMGNLNKWDGPFPESWHNDQLVLQHKILDRMRALGFYPVAPAFAGFVPEGFKRLHPDLAVNSLKWGGFPKENNAFVLAPGNSWFKKIGELFIKEWEKEFGKNKFYLSDSFNEMDVPVAKDDPQKKYKVLADYGDAIYQSIHAGNPDAVWVTQGWTFGFQHSFWDQPSLKSMLSKVPDDKMLILDLANEYPPYVWYIDPVWKIHQGFYGKRWIYSFVPNFGGKTPYTGVLPLYASAPVDALHSAYGKNLAGFGFAPEGIENNEVIYELLADMGWSSQTLDLNQWGLDYYKARYGACPFKMMIAGQKLLESCYNTFSSYPRFVWQTVKPDGIRKGSPNSDPSFLWAVENFLDCSTELKQSELYRNDALEMAALYLSLKADDFYKRALHADSIGDNRLKKDAGSKAIELLINVDRLLESHPTDRLLPWIDFARSHGNTLKDKDYYESNAKRLITSWGGIQSDYAARLWGGLIREYYIPRMQLTLFDQKVDRISWEEAWIRKSGISKIMPFDDPVQKAKDLVQQFRK